MKVIITSNCQGLTIHFLQLCNEAESDLSVILKLLIKGLVSEEIPVLL